MMLKQIRYFQAVVRLNSFSEAAEECHISQSAISQQIQALERELGFSLLTRANRKFALTPAGEHFYKKSLVLLSDWERLCQESAHIAHSEAGILRIGCLRSYGGPEFFHAVEAFTCKYPDRSVTIAYGNHEELYHLSISRKVDIILSDQRRAFSAEYENMVLAELPTQIEVAARNPMARLPALTPDDLKNTPCILVSSKEQQEVEREYYFNIVGFRGEFLFVENLEEAHMAVVSGRGFLPVEGDAAERVHGIAKVPLCHGIVPITRTYCAFWPKENSDYYVEEFAGILKQQFE